MLGVNQMMSATCGVGVEMRPSLPRRARTRELAVRTRRILYLLTNILSLVTTAALGQTVEVNGIEAIHRNGQTFVTWRDVEEGERGAKYRYSLYRADSPITQETLAQATLVYRGVPNNSAKLFGSDFWPKDRLDPAKPTVVLNEGGPPLALWSGLAVYTAKAEGNGFFAVVATNEALRPLSRVEPGKSATIRPLAERVGAIQPIKVYDSKERPTYVAQTSITGTKGLPMMLVLHGSQAQGGGASEWGDYYTYFGSESMGYRDGLPGVFSIEERRYPTGNILELKPRDAILHPNGKEPVETFWFGYLSAPQWARHKDPRAYPFTEDRLAWLLDWSATRYGADRDRIYAAGQSMGGWGVTTFALRHPEIFAAIYPTLPRTRQRELPGLEGRTLRSAIMPDGKTDYFERMDMVKFVSQTRTDLPFMGWSIGRQDRFATWKEQVDMVKALTASHHGFAFAWNDAGHSEEGTKPMELIHKYYGYTKLARNVSYPAFGNSSIDNNPGNGSPTDGDKAGGINLGFEWKDVEDMPDRWAIRLTNDLAKADMTVDVTPRRTQRFKPVPGERLRWTSSIGDSGEVTVDQWGLVTVERVGIKPAQDTIVTVSRVPRRSSPR